MFIEKTPSNNSEDLKKIREDKGLSFEDLYQRTRVRAIYLQAIENKEFHTLPLPVYAKNFIKIYAGALGIDSEPLMKEYEDYLNSLTDNTLLPEQPAAEKSSFSGIKVKKSYLIIAFILIVVIVAHWLITRQYETASDVVTPAGISHDDMRENKGQNLNVNSALSRQNHADSIVDSKENSKQSPAEETMNSIGMEKNEINTASRKISPPAANIPGSSDKEAGLLVVRAVAETWLRVKADQNQSFQVLLKAGEKFEYKAKSFEIDIGNAGGIKIKFREKDIENLGKAGEVVHLRLP